MEHLLFANHFATQITNQKERVLAPALRLYILLGEIKHETLEDSVRL